MTEIDLIENRIDAIKNIYTLYSYIKSSDDEREWALNKLAYAIWLVAEPFGDTWLFAPCHFVQYKNNTIEQSKRIGEDIENKRYLIEHQLYKKVKDDYLNSQFSLFLKAFGIIKSGYDVNLLIPYNWDTTTLHKNRECFFVSPTHCPRQKPNAWKSFLDKKLMAIGWEDEDYSDCSSNEICQKYPNDKSAHDAFKAIKQIDEGDIICCTNNSYGLWGIGVAVSSYKYESKIHYAGKSDGDEYYYSHYIDVAWLNYKDQGYIPQSDFDIGPNEKPWPPYGTLFNKGKIPQYITNYLLNPSTSNMTQDNRYDKYITLLLANKNLILTGAPGTGKTYLAKEIARQITGTGASGTNGQIEQVQFHPSFDYTDFVEGLRPTPPDANGNIGFERKDGIFKSFCKRAIEGELTNGVDNFNEIWSILIDKLGEEDFIDIPLLSQKNKTFRIELNVTGEGLANRTYPEDCLEKDSWIHGKSKFFSKEQLYNVYRGLKGIPSGGHDNYRKAIIQYLKEELGLKDYSPGNWEEEQPKPYVFIVDEINRGEISKIFGELFYSIDPDYRGMRGLVKTQYQNMITDESDPFYHGFYVPDNVYLIGTMNDIDRSVESMDFAMRRRFAWMEIKAEENTGMLDELTDLKEEVVDTMNRLNKALWDDENDTGIEGLSAAYHIGGSYFKKLTLYLKDDYSNKEEAYRQLWENHLKGILSEYLRGSYHASENMSLLENVYYNQDTDHDIEG